MRPAPLAAAFYEPLHSQCQQFFLKNICKMFQQVISCSSFLKQPRKRDFAALSEQETGQGCRTPGGFETCATRIKSDEEQKSRGKTAIRLARSTPGHVPAAEAEWAKSSRPGRRAWEQPPAGTVVLRQKRLGMRVCILLICMIFHAMTMHWSELNSERAPKPCSKNHGFQKGAAGLCPCHSPAVPAFGRRPQGEAGNLPEYPSGHPSGVFAGQFRHRPKGLVQKPSGLLDLRADHGGSAGRASTNARHAVPGPLSTKWYPCNQVSFCQSSSL